LLINARVQVWFAQQAKLFARKLLRRRRLQLALEPKLLKLAEFGMHRGEYIVSGLRGVPLHDQPVQSGLLLVDSCLGVTNELFRFLVSRLGHVNHSTMRHNAPGGSPVPWY